MESNNNIIRGLVLIYGIPGSGKSYFSNEIIKNFPNFRQNLIIYMELDEIEFFTNRCKSNDEEFLREFEIYFKKLSSDSKLIKIDEFLQTVEKKEVLQHEKNSMIKDVKNNEIQTYFFENKIWKYSRDLSLRLCEKILEFEEKTNQSFIIIIDDNFLLKSMRKKYYQLCNK